MSVYPFEPLESDFPRGRSLVVLRRTSTAAADPQAPILSFSVCSRLPGSAAAAARWVRGHWAGGEFRNHWGRDALWGEDRTRSKHWKLNANLAILRAGLIALRAACAPEPSWPDRFERCSHHPALACRLVTRHRFK